MSIARPQTETDRMKGLKAKRAKTKKRNSTHKKNGLDHGKGSAKAENKPPLTNVSNTLSTTLNKNAYFQKFVIFTVFQ